MRTIFTTLCLVVFGLYGCGGDPPSSTPADAAEDRLAPTDATTFDAPAPTDGAPAPVDAGPTGADVITPADVGTCPAGQTLCGATCVDLQTDPTRCGTCSRNCRVLPGVDATAITCERGLCTVGTHCLPGLADCDGETSNGCETDLTQNTACGSCGVTCMGATPVCALVMGDGGVPTRRCTNGCTPMTPTRCGGACVNTDTSLLHCGVCGRACATPNASPVCRGGVCAVGSCMAPFGNCDGDDANGCETDLTTSTSACGACGSPCASRPNTTARCDQGTCRYACTAGFGDCDGNPANGCETPLATTAAHCGACGRACALWNATAGCSLGACVVAACDVGFGDCNTNPADGCEADLRTSLSHCGGCYRRCEPPNAYPVCSAGMCRLVGCDPPYSDCDRNVANGCEVRLTTNENCGACGRVCAVGQTCADGACACPTGQTLCNGACVDTSTSTANCGGCGRSCPVGISCVGGMCGTRPTMQILVVGGGGGGGGGAGSAARGGGGGAGGLRLNSALEVAVGSYTITVGAGGAATSGAVQGNDGNPSSFGTMIVAAGGGGGGYTIAGVNSSAGSPGGSGGGGSAGYCHSSWPGGAGMSGQGNAGGVGGRGCVQGGGGGGGGAGAAGTDDTAGGFGGAGFTSSISGTPVTYAAGGGSGEIANGAPGAANTGNGGGGAGGTGNGGAGGSGVVIVRYLTSDWSGFRITGGSISSSGAFTIRTFTTSGTLSVSTL